MFNGVPDQFHQFGPSLPFPLSFPLHHHGVIMSPTTTSIQNFPVVPSCFDLYPPSISTPPQQHVLQIHQQQSCTIRKEKEGGEEEEEINILATNNVVEIEDHVERSMYHHESSLDNLWSNDEVLALFKIRSGLENWFPDFTWDHVSRKLTELGYQRSAEKCKEKFEEESRQLNDINYSKNYRFLTELNEIYHVEIPQIVPADKNPVSEEQNGGGDEEKEVEEKRDCDDDDDDTAKNLSQEIVVEKAVKKRKRKKDEEFEIFMGFCGSVVKKVIEKQEEMHNKLIEDIVKKEEESIAREEAWRIQERFKIEKEIQLRVQEKANASEKQAQMIDLLKKIIPFDSSTLEEDDQITLFKKMEDPFINHSKITTLSLPNDPNRIKSSSKPSSSQIQDNPHVGIIPLVSSTSMESFGAKDTGKRWPREEVLALINIRCKLNSNNNNNNNNNYNMNEDKDSAAIKGPLWERISKGMMEMGYKRSAKRCKEKWENINKYFRKTKDNKKKRTQDSRTCPYFQHLSTLYSHHQQGGIGIGIGIGYELLSEKDTPTYQKLILD